MTLPSSIGGTETSPSSGAPARRPGCGALFAPSRASSGGGRWGSVVERLWLLVELSLAWWIAVVAGLIVFGVCPASAALADALHAADTDRVVRPFRDVLRGARRQFWPVTARLLPLLLVHVLSLCTFMLTVSGEVSGPGTMLVLGIASTVSASWSLASWGLLIGHARLRRQGILTCWRIALLAPAAMPSSALAMVLGTALATIGSLLVPVLSVVIWPAIVGLLAARTLGRRAQVMIEPRESQTTPSASL